MGKKKTAKRKRGRGRVRSFFVNSPGFLLIAMGMAFCMLSQNRGIDDDFDLFSDLVLLSDFDLELDSYLAFLPIIYVGSILLGTTTFSHDWQRKKKGTFDVRPGDLDHYWIKKLKGRVLLVLAALAFGCLASTAGFIGWVIYEEGPLEFDRYISLSALSAMLFSDLLRTLEAALAVGMTTMLVGQYYSQSLKSSVYAPLATVFLSIFPLAWWIYAGYLGGVPFYWTLLPLWIAMLVSTRTRMRTRFHDKFVTYRSRRKAKMQRRAAWLLAIVVTCVACPVHRVRQIQVIDYGYQEHPPLFHATRHLSGGEDEPTPFFIDEYEIPTSQVWRSQRCLSRLDPEKFLQVCESEDKESGLRKRFEGRIPAIEADAESRDAVSPEVNDQRIQLLLQLCALIHEREQNHRSEHEFSPHGLLQPEEAEAVLYQELRDWADSPEQHPALLVEAIQYLQNLERVEDSRIVNLYLRHGHDVTLVRHGYHADPFYAQSIDLEKDMSAKERRELDLLRWYYRLQPWERVRMERALDSTYQQLANIYEKAENAILYEGGNYEIVYGQDLPPFSEWDMYWSDKKPNPYPENLLFLPADANDFGQVVTLMHENETNRRTTLIYLALRWHFLEYGELPDSLSELSQLTELSPFVETREWESFTFPTEIPNQPGGQVPFYYMPEDETALMSPSILEELKERYSDSEDPEHDPIMPYLWYDEYGYSRDHSPHMYPEMHDQSHWGVFIDLHFVRETPVAPPEEVFEADEGVEDTPPTTGESPSDREVVEPTEEEPLEVIEPTEETPVE
jgi:hypothetical protein